MSTGDAFGAGAILGAFFVGAAFWFAGNVWVMRETAKVESRVVHEQRANCCRLRGGKMLGDKCVRSYEEVK